jgi:hypothetical protein
MDLLYPGTSTSWQEPVSKHVSVEAQGLWPRTATRKRGQGSNGSPQHDLPVMNGPVAALELGDYSQERLLCHTPRTERRGQGLPKAAAFLPVLLFELVNLEPIRDITAWPRGKALVPRLTLCLGFNAL